MTFRPITFPLHSAALCDPPAPLCNLRPRASRGKKQAGLVYERKLARALPEAAHSLWFSFRDANGPGYCQPDFALVLPTAGQSQPKCVLILEAKYSWSPEAHLQLSQLYIPVVSLAFGLPAFGAVVCKNLRAHGMQGCAIFNSFRDLLDQALSPAPSRLVLHWLGVGAPPALPTQALPTVGPEKDRVGVAHPLPHKAPTTPQPDPTMDLGI